MSETPLFPDLPESLSPFAKWKREHGLMVWHTPNLHPDAEDEFTGEQILAWTCAKQQDAENGQLGTDTATTGNTEEEACEAYCLRFRLKHWSIKP